MGDEREEGTNSTDESATGHKRGYRCPLRWNSVLAIRIVTTHMPCSTQVDHAEHKTKQCCPITISFP